MIEKKGVMELIYLTMMALSIWLGTTIYKKKNRSQKFTYCLIKVHYWKTEGVNKNKTKIENYWFYDTSKPEEIIDSVTKHIEARGANKVYKIYRNHQLIYTH